MSQDSPHQEWPQQEIAFYAERVLVQSTAIAGASQGQAPPRILRAASQRRDGGLRTETGIARRLVRRLYRVPIFGFFLRSFANFFRLPYLLTEVQVGLERAEIGFVMLRELQIQIATHQQTFVNLEKQLVAQRHELEVLSRDLQEFYPRLSRMQRILEAIAERNSGSAELRRHKS